MEPFKLNGNVFNLVEWTNVAGLKAGFTSRGNDLNLGLHVGDGYDKVISNRKTIAYEVGFPLENWICTEQTHRDNILKVDSTFKGLGSDDFEKAIRDTDGLYTSEKGIMLTQFYADCTPIHFLHESTQTIGVVHAGWKGTVLGIAGKMIRTLEEAEGINPSEVKVVIGPAICPKCYEVGGELVTRAREAFGEKVDDILYTDAYNKTYFDMQKANEFYLIKAGVDLKNISKTKHCTCCEMDKFFSHRRESGKTGRMLAYIGWEEENE